MRLFDQPVWQYWEGPMPGYIEACMETVRRHPPRVRMLSRAAFDELWTRDRDVPIDHLSAQHRADFIRVYLLRHHGGLWLDTDFVQLRRLRELDALPRGVSFAGYREDDGWFANGLLFSAPGDPVVRHLYAAVCRHLRARLPLRWHEIGAYQLAAAIAAHPEAVLRLPTDVVCSVPWHRTREALEVPGDAVPLLVGDPAGVMLHNSTTSEQLRRRSREAFLADGSVLSHLVRRAAPPPRAPRGSLQAVPPAGQAGAFSITPSRPSRRA